ncbi:hypothetical protein BDP27DRAFT_1339099 [Rhodocollybia butyracea]|uniref:Uncharacterized protein n=1 Tax=Rhodocollybia butyracea TaxID=206335 RepID=A0A9P5PDL7_9AGAR|nr:hypothetical protein BDP27DRAFT_1339099 [Rhodocollybia butyracea]
MLESFTFMPESTIPQESLKPILTWSNSPRLHTLVLDISFHVLDQLVFPWHQIQHLTMENIDVNEMHLALRLSTSIVSATFNYCINEFSFRDPIPYTCSLLTSLTIRANRRLETLGPDITHCVFPFLQTLSITGGLEEFSFSHGIVPCITALIIRSGCHLTSLTLHGVSYNSKLLMELLQAVSPSLTKLDLCDVDHRAWNFLQMDLWLLMTLIWVPTSTPWEDEAHTHTFTSPGQMLPYLREFGIRTPSPSSARRDLTSHDKIEVVVKIVESRFEHPESHTPNNQDNTNNMNTQNQNTQNTPNSPNTLNPNTPNHVLPSPATHTGTVLKQIHLGRLWAARIPDKLTQRLRALEDAGLKISAL